MLLRNLDLQKYIGLAKLYFEVESSDLSMARDGRVEEYDSCISYRSLIQNLFPKYIFKLLFWKNEDVSHLPMDEVWMGYV